MKVYKDGAEMNAVQVQLEILEDAGWSRTKPEPKPEVNDDSDKVDDSDKKDDSDKTKAASGTDKKAPAKVVKIKTKIPTK